MTDTRTPAPRLNRDDVAYLIATPAAVAVLDLTDGRVYPTIARRGASDPFESPTLLVLATHDDAIHYAAEARGNAGRVTRLLNLELHALAARGEIPTAAEVAEVLAELAQLDAEVIELRAVTA